MRRLTALLGTIRNTPVVRTCALLAIGLLLGSCASARSPAVLTEQVKSARTPDEHRAVANGYREYSQRLRADAAKHANLATWWSNLPDDWEAGSRNEGGRARDMRASRDQEAQHCRALADSLSRAAAAAEAIADAHEQSAPGSGDR